MESGRSFGSRRGMGKARRVAAVTVTLVACSSTTMMLDGGVTDSGTIDSGKDATLTDSAVLDASTDTGPSDATVADVAAEASATDSPCDDSPVDGSTLKLATAQYSTFIAIDSANVYWGSGNVIRTCAIGGCGGTPGTLTTLPTGQTAYALAVDSTHVYATAIAGPADAGSSYVMSCSTAGCDAGVVLAGGQSQPLAIAIDGTNVYWTDFGTGNVMACAKTGCTTPTTIAIGQNGPAGIATDGTSVYWGNTGLADGGGGSLASCPVTGCDGGAATLIGDPTVGVAMYGSDVYFTIATGVGGYVMRRSSDGGIQTLSDLQDQPAYLAVDGVNVYWTNNVAGGFVEECNVNGCCQSPRMITTEDFGKGVAVDSKHVYWAGGGSFDIVQFTPQ